MVINRFTTVILKRRILSLIILSVLCAYGFYSWSKLDIEAYPDISDIEVSIITQMNGFPSEEMEAQITIPIERSMNTIPHIISKTSRTIFGLSIVRLTFEDGTDIYKARQMIQEKLVDAVLPNGANPKLGPMTPSIGEIFRYVIEADDKYSLSELREYHDYIIIPKLLQSKGIVDVVNFGGLIRQYQIILNPLQLEKYSLGVSTVTQALQNNNKNTGANYITVGSSQMNIRGMGRITKLQDIENIVVENRSGVPILIKDLGTVEVGYKPPQGILGFIDKNNNISNDNGLEGIVLLRKFENPSNVILSVNEKINELNNKILPHDIKIVPIYDRSQLVSVTIKTVGETIFFGILIVYVILQFFLGSSRGAIISSLAIPFSLLFSFICMNLANIPVNLFSLGAIDFGIIVDSSIVMVEGIFRHLSIKNLKNREKEFFKEIEISSKEVQNQIFFSVIIIILALLPILSLQRVEGRLFTPMAWTLSFAIFGSMIYSLTVVPILSSYFLVDFTKPRDNFLILYIEEIYTKILKKVLERKNLFLFPLFSGIVLIYLFSFRIGSEFLPELDEGSIWIRMFLPPGISYQHSKQYPNKVRDIFSKYDEVNSVLTQLGRNDSGTDPYGTNRIEILLQLKQPYSHWKNFKNKPELISAINKDLKGNFPGTTFNITQPIIDTTTENATGTSADLAVFLNGKNLDEMRIYAEKIYEIMKTVPGSSESSIEQEEKQTQLTVSINRESAARYGINVEEINIILETAIGGMPVSKLYENERVFDIIIRFTTESRNTPENIGKILIPTKAGNRIPLSYVADIKLEEGQTIIFRQDGERQIIVKTNIRGRDQASFAHELNHRIRSEISLPSEMNYQLGGQFENLFRAKNRMKYIVPVSLILIYLILFIYFNNHFSHAFIVFMNIPLAVAGGIFGLIIRGMNFNISAAVGFVSLFGISVMSGVLLLAHLRKDLFHDPDKNLKDLVIEGSKVQFRPRFFVMFVAIIGLFPAMFHSGIGSDIQKPFATVIVSGLSASLLLGIFISPLLFYIYESKHRHNT